MMSLKCLIFLVLLECCWSYKILLVFPVPGKSHSILGEGYVRHLLDAGHEVTYVTPFPVKNPPKNLRNIDVSENKNFFDMNLFDIKVVMANVIDFQDQRSFVAPTSNLWKKTAQLENVQKLMNDPNEKFDAVIVEWLYSELISGLAAVFNCPLIWSSSMAPHTFVVSLVHDHLNPAYNFHHLSKDYSFTFVQRVKELWSLFEVSYHKWTNENEEIDDYKELYESAVNKRGRTLPHYFDVKYNASLVLGNSDVITTDGIALPQSYKNIGGYHIKDTIEPLPQNLKEIFDNAKDGVIYFSMGSNLKSSNIPEAIKRDLLNMFSEFKETVIWKLEKPISDLPKNVHIVSWAPQTSILAHPKCKLFISHGGLLSILETLKLGKPIIGIPFFADQFLNVNRAVAKGFGIRVDFSENVAPVLKVAIKEILENPSYQQRAKELSNVYNDRLVPPGKELVHWVEHVVRTKGAPHLRSAALRVSWYQKMYLDLLLIVVIALVIISMFCKKMFAIIRTESHLKKKIQ